MAAFCGTIALDIDGTITINKHVLEGAVQKKLHELMEAGWELIFVTGRTFSFALPILSSIQGSYALAVQNGASLYKMPEEKLLAKHYLPKEVIPFLDSVLQEEAGGLLVESGRELGDVCYFKPEDFSLKEREYLDFRISISKERWKPVASFEGLDLTHFPVGKYFASFEEAHRIARKMRNCPLFPLNVVVISDPFRPGFFLAHINKEGASKGAIVKEWMEKTHKKRPLIVAGDDYNDVEMLQLGDVKIVMETAPVELHPMADILAPPADTLGIISALERALRV